MAKKIKCPAMFCGSTNVVPVDQKRGYSISKGLIGNTVGGLVAGPAGAVVGLATGIGGKRGKTKFICQKCGKVFEVKI